MFVHTLVKALRDVSSHFDQDTVGGLVRRGNRTVEFKVTINPAA